LLSTRLVIGALSFLACCCTGRPRTTCAAGADPEDPSTFPAMLGADPRVAGRTRSAAS
jgi:hypothetical protein